MRILTLNYEFPPLGGGAAPVTEELAANLASRGHEVDVVTMHYGELPSRERRRGITIYRTWALRSSKSVSRPHEMLSYLPSGFLHARRLVSERDYDVVHAHFLVPTGVIAHALKKLYDIPYLVTSHGSDVPGYNPDRFGRIHGLVRPIWRRVGAGAAAIVSPSEHLARLMDSAEVTAPIRMIPNGFDHAKFDPADPKEERILLTNRLFERKGVQYFLDALGEIRTDWEVVITGEGPYLAELRDQAAELDVAVQFPGWVSRSRLEELLERSAIYVFPSSHENCPVALQEAMAAGCAIVASRYSGTGEVIGDAGLPVDPQDTQAFSAALSRLISTPSLRTRLANAARERIANEYDWDRITSRYERLMAELADRETNAIDVKAAASDLTDPTQTNESAPKGAHRTSRGR